MDTKKVTGTINTISGFLKSEDLANVLETAEDIAKVTNIPFLPLIIKILKVLVKGQPLVQSASNIVGNVAAPNKNEKDKFKRLFDIAMDDGVITAEEKEILRPCALKAGYSNEEFEMMVLAKKIL